MHACRSTLEDPTSGNSALIAAGEHGLLVVDLTNPAAPALAGYYDTSGSAQALGHDGASVAMATGVAQHWLLECTTCKASCALGFTISPPQASVCPGTAIDLAASTPACANGAVTWQWLEDGRVVAGATTASYRVPQDLPPGSFAVVAVATCPGGCSGWASSAIEIRADTGPALKPNSLRVVHSPLGHALSWQILGAAGAVNLHATFVKTALPALASDLSSAFASTASLSYENGLQPPAGTPLYYQVFPRAACSGRSIEP